jgi:DNA repair protein RecO
MSLITTHGIVLRRQRHLENDVRLTLFLRDEGKVIATVKGGQRFGSRLRVFQEPFTHADFQVFLPPHGTYARIIQGKLVDSHHLLRGSVSAFQTACRIVEVMDVLFPFRAPSAEAFDILGSTLQSLRTNPNATIEWIQFLLKLLTVLGHGDHSQDVLRRLDPGDPVTIDRCLAFVETQLEHILPKKLKSADVQL